MENKKDNNSKKPVKSPSKKNDKLTALDKAQINELLSQSIQNFVDRSKKEARDVDEVINLIDTHLSEFLQAFVIFGYDMKGQSICIHHATNQMDSDAINSLINRVLQQGLE
jgi:hypothetical protein